MGEIPMSASHFKKAFTNYCNSQGQQMNMSVSLENQQLDLHLMWRLVASLGGFGTVSRLFLWPTIAEQLLNVRYTDELAEKVQRIYQEKLAGFEQYIKQSGHVPAKAVLKANSKSVSNEQPVLCFRPSLLGNNGQGARNLNGPKISSTVVLQQPQKLSSEAPLGLENDLEANKQGNGARLADIQVGPTKSTPRKGANPSPLKRQKTGKESAKDVVKIPTAKIVAPHRESPGKSVPNWASQQGVFFPKPQSGGDRPPVAPQSRDPRVQASAFLGQSSQRDPRQASAQASATAGTSGFQPLLVSRAAVRPSIPSATPQIRPLTDPFANFSVNPQLKAKISEAMASQRKNLRLAGERAPHAPVRGGAPGFKLLTSPLRGHQSQAVLAASDQQGSRREGAPGVHSTQVMQLNPAAAAQQKQQLHPVTAAKPLSSIKDKKALPAPDAGTQERAQRKEVNLNALATRPDVKGWSQNETTNQRHRRAKAMTQLHEDCRGGALTGSHEGIAYIPAMKPSAAPGAVLSNNRQWQQAGLSHSPKELDVKKMLLSVKQAASSVAIQPAVIEVEKGSKWRPEKGRVVPDEASVQQGQLRIPAMAPEDKEFLHRFRQAKWGEKPFLPPRTASLPSASQTPEPGEVGEPRRSRRVRNPPAIFAPASGDAHASHRALSETSSEASEGIHEGPEYQAELPVCMPKPRPGSQPTQQEAAWLQHRVLERGSFADPSTCAPLRTLPPQADGEQQYMAGYGSKQRLLTALEVVSLGLDCMGISDAVGWTASEIKLFEQGLEKYARNFELIATDLLPVKGPHRVGSFYYNVWKTQAIPQATAWYRRREEAREREEQERIAEERMRQEAHAQYTAKRQLRESLAWLKSTARHPKGFVNLTVKAERMTRATQAVARAKILAEGLKSKQRH